MADPNSCIHHKELGLIFAETAANHRIPGHDQLFCVLCYALGVKHSFLMEYLPELAGEMGTGEFLHAPSESAGEEDWTTEGKNHELERDFDLSSVGLQVLPWDHSPVNNFAIRRGENGETYHGLVAALLRKNNKVEITGAAVPQVWFLKYYLPGSSIVRGTPGNRKSATKDIGDTFALNGKVQGKLHGYLRSYFTESLLAQRFPCPLVTTASLAMYYFVAYLALAKQANNKLSGFPHPAADTTHQVALVLVRRTQAAGDARTMTEMNLLSVLGTFASINRQVRKGKVAATKSITHVILYGDLQVAEVLALNQLFYGKEDGFLCIHLPSPFDPSAEKSNAYRLLRTTDPYSKFRDYVPLEAKLLCLFIALQESYGFKMFVVGFRSGTIDGAAFLGLPIYYLDDTTVESRADYQKTYESGKYLIDPGEDANRDERILHLTRTMDVFVRINFLPVRVKGAFVLDNNALLHLKAALWIWQCNVNEDNQEPQWTRRNALMRDSAHIKRLREQLAEGLDTRVD